MSIYMRSTFVIEDHLFRMAKRRAAELNITVSEVVNQALRESLSRPEARPSRFEMMTFGGSEPTLHHEPADFSSALLSEDEESIRR
jgi:hypothetical protein